MDPAFQDLFQTFAILVGTWILYKGVLKKHREWTCELRAFRSTELSGNPNTDPEVKVVSDPRLGRLGLTSIWCDHPGANHNCTLCKLNRQNAPRPHRCTREEWEEHQRHV
jgi:hypothetical protein